MSFIKLAVRTSFAVFLMAAISPLTSDNAFAHYDGLWSVSIVTLIGNCIASYRYPMRISNGVLANGGDIAIDVRGKVDSSGAIKVLVIYGDAKASGFGRLAARIGSGTWRSSFCSGKWTAERRSQ